MVIIPLGHGKAAIIDDDDADMVSHFKWTLKKIKTLFYATAYVPQSGKKSAKRINLHGLIMCFPTKRIDHINGDGLDCRKKNLREVTASQNVMNQRIRSDSKTGFRGVSINSESRKKPFRANIAVNGKIKWIGAFATAIEAAKAYNEASIKFHGEYGRRNLIPPG